MQHPIRVKQYFSSCRNKDEMPITDVYGMYHMSVSKIRPKFEGRCNSRQVHPSQLKLLTTESMLLQNARSFKYTVVMIAVSSSSRLFGHRFR
jgi:hypothetical protein